MAQVVSLVSSAEVAAANTQTFLGTLKADVVSLLDPSRLVEEPLSSLRHMRLSLNMCLLIRYMCVIVCELL